MVGSIKPQLVSAFRCNKQKQLLLSTVCFASIIRQSGWCFMALPFPPALFCLLLVSSKVMATDDLEWFEGVHLPSGKSGLISAPFVEIVDGTDDSGVFD